jgi:hypothetical protein
MHERTEKYVIGKSVVILQRKPQILYSFIYVCGNIQNPSELVCPIQN